ncbi:MAG: 23S rRNA (guanosine-2'-O-)-methyltransferase RlmB [Chlamydiales bacterium]|nr:23S rRNA (guanosine-2'-O-)-methyltransferase RlmB [Chlamydiales bacterium]MCH9619545.1 23S rRNA (guanosine-2'-O-)-methyltransferase RlmB [Chlamydiales bacterium]MCH9623151.1 23S rRNA (guanosine-2'-O-)-methyltransferase RlmB [Chlamydiales bacterium]
MGNKIVQEVMEQTPPKALFTRENVTESILKKVTGLPAPEEMVAEFPMPQKSSVENLPSLLVLDEVSDPGNLGTLLRTALALSFGGAFFLNGCADPFNDKALRASRAALFKLPWNQGNFEDLLSISSGFTPLVADLEGAPLNTLERPTRPLLVLSNEARGPSDQMEHFGQKVTIPIANMESLNVATAGGILMYTL